MLSSEKTIDYQIKKSRSGNEIPVINGIHLHSIYNPEKEAESFIDKYDDSLKKKKNILVLGLGFGYHIQEIIFRLKRYHGESFYVSVIEPCEQTVKHFERIYHNSLQNIKIYTNDNIDKLYQTRSLVDFLTQNPKIISHPASYNLFEDYFKQFLSFRASKLLGPIRAQIEDKVLSSYLETFPEDYDLTNCAESILQRRSPVTNKNDFLILAYNQLTSSASKRRSHDQ